MTSKEKLEEVLDILLDSFKDPQDEDDDCYMFNRRQMIKISKAIEKAQKQEKLLELYRYLNENTNDYDLHYDKVDEIDNEIDIIEKQIKELEKDTPLKPNDNLMKGYYHCSKCGREIPECVNKHFMRYCPNCGQKLKGDKEL